jgi:hypothetical protein
VLDKYTGAKGKVCTRRQRERRGVLHGRMLTAGKRLSEFEEVRFGGVAMLVMAGVSH